MKNSADKPVAYARSRRSLQIFLSTRRFSILTAFALLYSGQIHVSSFDVYSTTRTRQTASHRIANARTKSSFTTTSGTDLQQLRTPPYAFAGTKAYVPKTTIPKTTIYSSKIDLDMEHQQIEDVISPILNNNATMTEDNTDTNKFLNAFLLVACFGLALSTILNVDSGMTRGWTVSEQAMRIPLDNWASYESSLNTQPIATKTSINVIIYLLGDWLSQTIFVNKSPLEFDARRTARNGLIGLAFGPIVHQYYEFSDSILPVEIGINRFYKILMDQTLYLSIKCSVYIVAVNMLAGESWEYSSGVAKEKIRDIMVTAWKFWPLVHCVTYGCIPARHRILWVNCVDLFWNAILALKTSAATEEDDTVVLDMVEGDSNKIDTNSTKSHGVLARNGEDEYINQESKENDTGNGEGERQDNGHPSLISESDSNELVEIISNMNDFEESQSPQVAKTTTM